MGVFDGIPGYEERIFDAGKEPLFLLLVAFLVAFALTRLYTRLARTHGLGSASAGGVHVHHLVVGIFLMVAAGVLIFALQPGRVATGMLAIGFGVGAALTLDEFALWFYLEDVYWSEEGRSSIDATIVVVLAVALMLVGASPFGIQGERDATDSDVLFSMVIAFHVVWVILALLKGKLLFGAVSFFVPLIGFIGAVRLAQPSSPWARWFYRGDGGKPWPVRWLHRNGEKKLARSRERYSEGWPVRFERWFQNTVGGTPHLPSPFHAHGDRAQEEGGSNSEKHEH